MSLQGILLLDLFGVALIALTVNLVRTRKLHTAFAVIWLLALVGMIAIVSIPALLAFVTRVVVGAIFPASALTLLAFALVFCMLISFSMQLSVISARQIELAQNLALKELLLQDKLADSDGDQSDVTTSRREVVVDLGSLS
jgi:hypothetical protein